MVALRSLTDDDFDAAYERAEDFGQSVRAEGWYDGWDGPDAAGTVLLHAVDRVIESLAVEHPPRDGAARDERLPSTASATERSAA